MNTLQLCRYLISVNKETIESTAMRNCHCLGLSSFIVNLKPKVRLFVAEPHCELFEKFDPSSPVIPIHPHKYDDIFLQLEGNLVHHLYAEGNDFEFSKYAYLRLSDKSSKLEKIGKGCLQYLGEDVGVNSLPAKKLHTASLVGPKCSWLIVETFEDASFEQVSYSKHLEDRPELYTHFPNSYEYLCSYFQVPN